MGYGSIRLPAPLQFSLGNVTKRRRKWKQELENYLLAKEKDERADKIKIAFLLNLLGSEGLEIYNTIKFESPESKANFSEVLQKFEEYCSPRQKTLASTCEFAEQENGLIRDRIVLGIKDNGLQERLLRENNLSLEKAIEIVRTAEASREQIQNMKYDTAMVNFVKENQNKPKTHYDCKKCGRKHKPQECPAFRKICAKYVYIDSVNVHETKCEIINATDSNVNNAEMDKLEKEGIVSKVNKPTDWVLSLVIVEKRYGNLRLCSDPRDLNTVIKREHYQIPCTDDIISRLEVSAPEVLQKRNQKLLGNIEGVEIYFYDIIDAECDEDSHDTIMSKILKRERSLNIKFNPERKLHPQRYGFVHFEDSRSATYLIQKAIVDAKSEKKYFVGISVDIKRAYDSIYVDGLLYKCLQIAEALAICQALDYLSVTNKNLQILSDSLSVLSALQNYSIKSHSVIYKLGVSKEERESEQIKYLEEPFMLHDPFYSIVDA
ncbi:transposon Ty3-G Gag-Pol polyprotein [Trichonephila clavipes]|nr:transposon Ty3-G Gag-Pol polyprotein [Trichonephila clavipes]